MHAEGENSYPRPDESVNHALQAEAIELPLGAAGGIFNTLEAAAASVYGEDEDDVSLAIVNPEHPSQSPVIVWRPLPEEGEATCYEINITEAVSDGSDSTGQILILTQQGDDLKLTGYETFDKLRMSMNGGELLNAWHKLTEQIKTGIIFDYFDYESICEASKKIAESEQMQLTTRAGYLLRTLIDDGAFGYEGDEPVEERRYARWMPPETFEDDQPLPWPCRVDWFCTRRQRGGYVVEIGTAAGDRCIQLAYTEAENKLAVHVAKIEGDDLIDIPLSNEEKIKELNILIPQLTPEHLREFVIHHGEES